MHFIKFYLIFYYNVRSIITVGDDHKIKIKSLKNEDNSKVLTNHTNKVTAIELFVSNNN